MSTDYAPFEKIRARDLFGGRLERFGVREHLTADTTETKRCLTDGRNYLWVHINDADFVSFTRYAPNGVPSKILNAIAEAFDSDIFSEYEAQYWGFDTEEEWDAAEAEEARKYAEEYYIELVKYLRGEPNDIQPGTIGMNKADIAKTLVEKDPTLLLPENKDKLLSETRSIYERDHPGIAIELSPQDLALAEMIATHEDDLPKA